MRNGEYLQSKKHSFWVSYFANGNKQSEGGYFLGNKAGAWTLYWPNGNMKSEATFDKGKYTEH